MKYDIAIMRQDRTAYLPTHEMKKSIVGDILSINDFFKQAITLADNFPVFSVDEQSIQFFSSNSASDVREYCCFFYSPKTPTGKESKYPLRLLFYTNKGIFGDIEYLQNSHIGKMHIVAWLKKQCFVIHCIVKKDILCISKIEHTDININGLKQVLYNINLK